MKVGDLVELSSAGNKNRQNTEVVGTFGLVMSVEEHSQYPYKIQWVGIRATDPMATEGRKILPMARYEIKKFRGAK